MDKSATLANWRRLPHSLQSFHQVDQLVPVHRIETSAPPRELPTQWRPLDEVTFKDRHGNKRCLPEVLEATATRGLVVLRQGRLVAESYYRGYDGAAPHILFSVSKSLTAALAGILVDKNMLDPERPVVKFIPEAAGSAYGDCTVQHLLDMTVSCIFSEQYLDTRGDYGRYRRATLWDPALPGKDPEPLHALLTSLRRAPVPHGEVFAYLSPNADLLGWVVERAAGSDFASLFANLVWKPMGAEADAYVTIDSQGAPRTAGGICVFLRDLARFGDLMRLGGAGILPQGWVEDIRSGGDRGPWQKGDMAYLFPDGRYHNQWYQTGHASGAFCAIGIHGQWLWIDPAREVVIAKVSAQAEPVDDETDLLLIPAFEAIAETLG